jgi:hypothetical protein
MQLHVLSSLVLCVVQLVRSAHRDGAAPPLPASSKAAAVRLFHNHTVKSLLLCVQGDSSSSSSSGAHVMELPMWLVAPQITIQLLDEVGEDRSLDAHADDVVACWVIGSVGDCYSSRGADEELAVALQPSDGTTQLMERLELLSPSRYVSDLWQQLPFVPGLHACLVSCVCPCCASCY